MSAALTDDQLACEWLKRRIELLSDLPIMWSRTAYTARRTTHTAFANGAIKEEGAVPAFTGAGCNPIALAHATFDAVEAYRNKIYGPVGLVWRAEPEVSRENGACRVYARLCFEPEIPMTEAAQ